jgi:hypothetical protein
MAIRMGRWDCPSCGNLKNMGNATHCVNCGAPRDPQVQFYLLSDEEEVKDKSKIAEARAGADWQCEYCSSENKALNKFCQSCGNPKDGVEKARQEKINYTPPVVREQYREPNIDNLPKEKPKPISYWKWLVVLAIAGALYYLFKPQKEQITITGFQWERTIKLEHYDWFEESGWDLPNGAKLLSKRQAVHHNNQVLAGYRTESRWVEVQTGTKRVKVGTKDLGNGYFEDVYEDQPVYSKRKENHEVPIYKDVPVYQTQYTYKIKKWKEVSPLKAEGTNQNPYDPKLSKSDPENWRLGYRQAYYWLNFNTEKGKSDKLLTDSAIWVRLKIGDKATAKTNRAGVYFGLEDEK